MTPGTLTAHDLGKRFTPHARPLTQLTRALIGSRAELPGATWAFRHLNLDLPPGAGLGVIGRNGAGKSTLLATLAGILQPDEGQCAAHGRVGTLLEIAAGFHPDFTGRENVELALQVAGLSRPAIAARIEQVKQFAAIGDAFEHPARTYSSGMLLRAAYAHITVLDLDLLLIDEVLAVGDALFQAKCYAHLTELRRKNVTRVLVSHDLSAILAQCDRVLVLDRGNPVFTGDPAAAIDFYRRECLADQGRLALAANPSKRPAELTALTVHAPSAPPSPTTASTAPTNRPLDTLRPGDRVSFALTFTAHQPIRHAAAGIEFHTPQGWMLGAVSTRLTPTPLPDLAPGQTCTVRFDLTLPFNPGRINLHAGITGFPADTPLADAPADAPTLAAAPFLDRRENWQTLEIVGDPHAAYGAVHLTPQVAVETK